MWQEPENDQYASEIYLPGEIVSPGIYQRLGDRHQVELNDHDYLPATLDGRVACYRKIDDILANNRLPIPTSPYPI